MSDSADVAKGARPKANPAGTPKSNAAQANAPLTAKRLLLLQALGLLAALIVGGLAFFIWHHGYYFYSTDDAVASGAMGTAASSSGTVLALHHQVGDAVNAGDPIATVNTGSGTTTVVSPITGAIYNIGVTPGQYVGAGQTLAQVTVLGSLYITAYVDEGTVRQVHVGQGVDVTVDNASMHGRVQLIVPVTAGTASPLPTTDYANGNFTKVNQRVPVHVQLFSSNGHSIYPGESANVTIHLHDNI